MLKTLSAYASDAGIVIMSSAKVYRLGYLDFCLSQNSTGFIASGSFGFNVLMYSVSSTSTDRGGESCCECDSLTDFDRNLNLFTAG